MKKVLGALRRAVQDYNMIKSGDVIAVGVSGGKDSVLLLEALERYRRFSPVPFSVFGIYVDMGFPQTDRRLLEELSVHFSTIGTRLEIIKTDLAQIIFEERKETNPCSLCSKMRRGALCGAAKEFGANKLALGHHADDVLETFLMSLAYEGRLSTFSPVSFMSRTGVTVIRPFVYLEESDVIRAVRSLELPVVKNACPADKHTTRQDAKLFVNRINGEVDGIKDRMLSAIFHPERNNLWSPSSRALGGISDNNDADDAGGL